MLPVREPPPGRSTIQHPALSGDPNP